MQMFFRKKRDRIYLDLGGRGWRLLRAGTAGRQLQRGEWPAGIIGGTFSRPAVDFSQLSALLAPVIGERPVDLFLVCPDQLVKFLCLTLPRDAASRDDREYVRFRLRRQLDPSIPRDIHLDFVVHDPGEAGTEVQAEGSEPAGAQPLDSKRLYCNALLARSDLVAGLRDALCGRRHHFQGLTSSSAALLARPLDEGVRDFALLHLGHEVSTVTIVSDGVMLYQRVIETAGRHLAEELARRRSLAPDQAEAAFRSLTLPGSPDSLPAALKDWPDTYALFARLIDEIQLTFKFYLETWRRGAVHRIYLSGGCALLEGIEGFFNRVFAAGCQRLVARHDPLDFSPAEVMLADFCKEGS